MSSPGEVLVHQTQFLKLLFGFVHNYVLLQSTCERHRQLAYLGHILDKEGIRPHPDKIKAITAMPEPKNQSELHSFLGMANYYNRFVPGLATNCAPLNDLLQNNKQWNWTSEHVEAVKSVKRLLTSADTLSHYDPSLPISLSCDASPGVLGQ